MRTYELLVPVLASLAFSGCPSPTQVACDKAVECQKDDCDFTDEACDAYYNDQTVQRCSGNADADLAAIRTGDDDSCEKCAAAKEALYLCRGSVDSCNAYEDTYNPGEDYGDCESEVEDQADECEDVTDDCLE